MMDIFRPEIGPVTIARGKPSTLGEIYDAGVEAARVVDNTNARAEALEQAIDARIDAVFGATGFRLDNPMRAGPSDEGLGGGAEAPEEADTLDARLEAFQDRLRLLAQERPEAADAIDAGRHVRDDAAEIARDAEERLGDVLSRRGAVSGFTAAFAGGFVGALRDPANIGLMLVGAGPARTILTGALRAAAINASGEAALQPVIQDWRREAGLPFGLKQAAFNVSVAAAFGGTLDFLGRSGARGVRALRNRRDEAAALDEAAARLPEDHVLRRALVMGDRRALAEAARSLPELPAVARGALHALDMERHADELAEGVLPEGPDPVPAAQARRWAEAPEEHAPPGFDETPVVPAARADALGEGDISTHTILAGRADEPVSDAPGDPLPAGFDTETQAHLAFLEETVDLGDAALKRALPDGVRFGDAGRPEAVTRSGTELLDDAERQGHLADLVEACNP